MEEIWHGGTAQIFIKLSTCGHMQIFIPTWMPWPHFERQKHHWSHPSKESIIPEKLPDIRLQMAQHCNQNFYPPVALGGVWGRLIQTAKWGQLIVLDSWKQTLSNFQAVKIEAHAILNSTLLNHVGCIISDRAPLTPYKLFLRRAHLCLKPRLNNKQRFSAMTSINSNTTWPLLEQVAKRMCSWSQQMNEVTKIKWRAEWGWNCVSAPGIHNSKNLSS